MNQILAIYWTLVTLYGALDTGRNLWDAYQDWRFLQRAKVPTSLCIAAFTPLRTHAILLLMHLTFILVGLTAVLWPTPEAHLRPATLAGYLIDLIFLAIPHYLIVISKTIRRDRARELAAARRHD